MATGNEIIVTIRGDARNYQAVLQRAGKMTQQLAGQMQGTGKGGAVGFGKAEKAAGGLFGTISKNIPHILGMAFGFAALYRGLMVVNAAIDNMVGGLTNFDENMRNVQSLTKVTDATLEKMGAELLSMASSGRSAGKSAVDLSDALYDIVSSGFEGQAALHLVEVAAQGAGAGITDTKVAAEVLVGVLNAYHLPASDAASVMSTLFGVVDKGIITFDELATSLGLVLSSASATGLTLEELGAGIVVLTRQGQRPSRVMTNLNAVLTAFLKPTDKAKEVAKSLGLELNVAALRSKGFPAVLAEIAEKAGDNPEQLAAMFRNVRAIRAILPLAANDGRDFANMLEYVGEAARSEAAHLLALEQQSKSLAFQMRVLGARIQAQFIKVLRPLTIWLAKNLPKAAAGIAFVFRDLTAGLRTLNMIPSWTKGLIAMAAAFTIVALAVRSLATALLAMKATSPVLFAVTMGAMALMTALGGLGFAMRKLKFEAADARAKLAELSTETKGFISGAASMTGVTGEAGEGAAEAAGEFEGLKDVFEETEKVASLTILTLERLADQFPAVGKALALFGQARDSLKGLSATLATARGAVEAHNRALIQQALAAASAFAPGAYQKASEAVDSLAAVHGDLTEQLTDEQSVLTDLEDEYDRQAKAVDRYERELSSLEDQLSAAEQAMRDLLSAPLAGEDEFARGIFAIEQAITQAELQVLQLGRGPAGAQQRQELEREIADLQEQRDRLEKERQLAVGPTEFALERLARRTEGPEVPIASAVSLMRSGVATVKDLRPEVAGLTSDLEDEKSILETLEGPLVTQRTLVEDLTSAIGEIATVMATFKSNLQSMVDFAVARLEELSTGGAGGEGAVDGEEFVEGWLPATDDVRGNITRWAQTTGGIVQDMIEKGMAPREVSEALRWRVVQEAMAGYRALLAAGVEPAEAARVVREEYLGAMEDAFGPLPPDLARIVGNAMSSGISAAPMLPETSDAVYKTASELSTLIKEANKAGLPDLADAYTTDLLAYLQLASDTFKPETFDFLASAVASNLLTPEQLKMSLEAAGMAPDAVEAVLKLLETESQRQYVADRLNDVGADNMDEISEGMMARAEEPWQYMSFWELYTKMLTDPMLYLEVVGTALSDLGGSLWSLIWDGMLWAVENLNPVDLWDKFKEKLGGAKDALGGFEVLPGVTLGDIGGWAKKGTAAGGLFGMLKGGQHGLRNFLGGAAMVGEGGRELALFPRGTSLASAPDTARILDMLKEGPRTGVTLAPQFNISAIGDRWDDLKMRLMAMVEESLDRAASEAGLSSPLTTHGVGVPRV